MLCLAVEDDLREYAIVEGLFCVLGEDVVVDELTENMRPWVAKGLYTDPVQHGTIAKLIDIAHIQQHPL